MESIQQPHQLPSSSGNQLHPDTDNNIRPSITVRLPSVQPHQHYQFDSDDDTEGMLFNQFISKYNNTLQTEQQDLLNDDSNEDEDIRMFLQQQVPGLYKQHVTNHYQTQCQLINKHNADSSIQNANNVESSLCVQYLGMNRWEKEEFFDNLNHIYMQRMRCERDENINRDRKFRDSRCRGTGNCNNNDNNKRKSKKVNNIFNKEGNRAEKGRRGGIRFSEIVSQVVFSRQDQPSVVGRTEQQLGVIVFDFQAYDQMVGDEDSSSDSSNSDSNSSSDSSANNSGHNSSNSNSESECSEQSRTSSDDGDSREMCVDSRDISSSSVDSLSAEQHVITNSPNLNTTALSTPKTLTTSTDHYDFNDDAEQQHQLLERRRKRLLSGLPATLNSQHPAQGLFAKIDLPQSVQQINGRKLVHHSPDDNTCDSQPNHHHHYQQQLIVLQPNNSTINYASTTVIDIAAQQLR